ncbi:MAG: hypothetical protein CUN52_10550, partial [Phototrophicales bacterium]
GQFNIRDSFTMRVDVAVNQIHVYLNDMLIFTHTLTTPLEMGQVGAYMTTGMGISAITIQGRSS